MRIFKDIETGETLTLEELKTEFYQLKADGETETETFFDYIRNCTAKNGTLEEVF